jgi:hypothetical protein
VPCLLSAIISAAVRAGSLSAAQANGNVHEGDFIVAVEQTPTAGIPYDEVIELIQVRKRISFAPFYAKNDHFTKQARDKHRESTQKQVRFLLQTCPRPMALTFCGAQRNDFLLFCCLV